MKLKVWFSTYTEGTAVYKACPSENKDDFDQETLIPLAEEIQRMGSDLFGKYFLPVQVEEKGEIVIQIVKDADTEDFGRFLGWVTLFNYLPS